MNIYNFIYCFFYRYWEKRNSDGRISGSIHVFFTAFIHFLIIVKIIWKINGIYALRFNFGQHGTSKFMHLIWSVPILILLILFYNRKRTKRLLEEFHQKYDNNRRKKTINLFLYLVLPFIVLLILLR